MTVSTDFDRLVASWLDVDGPDAIRPAVVDAALATARQRRQRRRIAGWTLGATSWPPSRATSSRMTAIRVAVVFVLVAVLAAGAAFVGRELLRGPDRLPPELQGVLTTRVTLPGLRSEPAPIVLPGGRLVILGDPGDGSIAAIVDVGSGQSVPVPPADRAFQPTAAAVLPDGTVLLLGVAGDRGAARILDPSAVSLGPEIPMAETRLGPAIASLADGRVLVSGGIPSDDEGSRPIASAEIYVPTTRTFTPTGSLAVSRSGHSMTALDDGRVLVVGGSAPIASSGPEGVASPPTHGAVLDLELFDPVHETFQRLGQLPAEQVRGRVVNGQVSPLRLPDGRVLIVGVQDGQYCGRHGTDPIATFLFDPSTSMLTPGHPIPHDITSAAVLPDGHVLVTGGWTFGTCQEDTEYIQDAWIGIHDPMTGVTLESRDPRTGAASLAVDTDRVYLSAVTLPDGRVALISDGGLFGIGGGEPAPQVVDVFE